MGATDPGSIPSGGQSAGSGGPGSALMNDPLIFGGTNTTKGGYSHTELGGPEGTRIGTFTPSSSWNTEHTMSSLERKFANSGNDAIRHMAFLLSLAGYGPGASTVQDAAKNAAQLSLPDVQKMYHDLLLNASQAYLMHRNLTPQDLLKEQLGYRLGAKWDGNLSKLTPATAGSLVIGGAGGAGGPGTTTSHSTSVDYLSPEDAKGMIRTSLQQQLGRDPTNAEYQDFIAMLHGAEAHNPQSSTTTQTIDANGNATTHSTTSGGLSQSGIDQAIYDKARQSPDWGVWQAMGTYAPALFAALGSPISGV